MLKWVVNRGGLGVMTTEEREDQQDTAKAIAMDSVLEAESATYPQTLPYDLPNDIEASLSGTSASPVGTEDTPAGIEVSPLGISTSLSTAKNVTKFFNNNNDVSARNSEEGSDPVSQSKSSKMYNRTVWLTEQSERERKLRTGAEKLLRVASSKRIRDEITMELKVVNGNLQAMREEMADIISNANLTPDLHQSKGIVAKSLFPMITFGMKETNVVDYQVALKDLIFNHYHEDLDKYRFDLNYLTEMRKACCQPLSGDDGLETLLTYYNQLYFIDRRFFPANSNGPVSFEWYDSFTGVPYVQKTVGFEKGSILFNIGILYSQKASKLKWNNPDDLTEAVEDFQRSAGAFQYLHDNFLYAPSVDMHSSSMDLLILLTTTQALECRLEQRLLKEKPEEHDVPNHLEVAQEASHISSLYAEALSLMSDPVLSNCIPSMWIPLMTCKAQYHKAIAHFRIATALSVAVTTEFSLVSGVHVRVDSKQQDSVYSEKMATEEEGRKTLAKAHLRQSILAFEEALKIVNKHQKFVTFQQTLKVYHDRSLSKFSILEEEDDFSELLAAPEILPKTKTSLQPILPDFSKYKVEDLFHRLGCIAIFSARHRWTIPRLVTLTKSEGEEFGFSIRGDSPVIVATVEDGSLAQRSGLFVGDFIVAVGGIDIKWTKHDKVVAMIKACKNSVCLDLVTPTDHNYIDPTQPPPLQEAMTSMTPERPTAFVEDKGKGKGKVKDKADRKDTENVEDKPALDMKADNKVKVDDKAKARPVSASWKLRHRNSRLKGVSGSGSNNDSCHSHSSSGP